MPRCCPGDNVPKITEGRHIETSGTGSPQDPLVVSATTDLDVQDNVVFNLVLDGQGNLESPWRLQVAFAPTARLDHLPDVVLPLDVPNGHVLTYDKINGRWTTQAPVVAPAGAVAASNGLDGDGSGGDPLVVVGDPTRLITVTAAGVGLSDTGINSLVRVFPTVAARDAASPAPAINTIALVETDPDRLDRWDGVAWVPITGGRNLDIDGQLLSLSGAYAGGSVTDYIRQFEAVTDSTGAFVVIPSEDLAGYSGVVECQVQETGNTFYHCQVSAGSDNIIGYARRVDTGDAYSGATVFGTVRALLY